MIEVGHYQYGVAHGANGKPFMYRCKIVTGLYTTASDWTLPEEVSTEIQLESIVRAAQGISDLPGEVS